MDKKAILEACEAAGIGAFDPDYVVRAILEAVLTAQEGECIHGTECPICTGDWSDWLDKEDR